MSYAAVTSRSNILNLLKFDTDLTTDLILEAPPIYQTLDRIFEISGDYEDATYEYSYSYSVSAPQAVRESMRSNVLSVDTNTSLDGVLKADTIGTTGSPSTNKIILTLLAHYPANESGDPVPFYHAARQALNFDLATYSVNNAVVGTRTKKSDSSTSDILETISLPAPFFSKSVDDTAGNRTTYDQITLSNGDVDISAFTDAQWRDLRGVYEVSDTDANGIVRTSTYTIGGAMGLDFAKAYNSSHLILI